MRISGVPKYQRLRRPIFKRHAVTLLLTFMQQDEVPVSGLQNRFFTSVLVSQVEIGVCFADLVPPFADSGSARLGLLLVASLYFLRPVVRFA